MSSAHVGAGSAAAAWAAAAQWPPGAEADAETAEADRRRIARAEALTKAVEMRCANRSETAPASSPVAAAARRATHANIPLADALHAPPWPSATKGRNCNP